MEDELTIVLDLAESEGSEKVLTALPDEVGNIVILGGGGEAGDD